MSAKNPAAYSAVKDRPDDQQQAASPHQWIERNRDYAVAEFAMKANDGKEPESWKREFFNLSNNLSDDANDKRFLVQAMVSEKLSVDDRRDVRQILTGMQHNADQRFDRLDASVIDTTAGRLDYKRCVSETWDDQLGTGRYRQILAGKTSDKQQADGAAAEPYQNIDQLTGLRRVMAERNRAADQQQASGQGQASGQDQTSDASQAAALNSMIDRIEANQQKKGLISELEHGTPSPGNGGDRREDLESKWERFKDIFPASDDAQAKERIGEFTRAATFAQTDKDLSDPLNNGAMGYLDPSSHMYNPNDANQERAHLSGIYRSALKNNLEHSPDANGTPNPSLRYLDTSVAIAINRTEGVADFARDYLANGPDEAPGNTYQGRYAPKIQWNQEEAESWNNVQQMSNGFINTHQLWEELEAREDRRKGVDWEDSKTLAACTDSTLHDMRVAQILTLGENDANQEAKRELQKLDTALQSGTATSDDWREIMDYMRQAELAQQLAYTAAERAETQHQTDIRELMGEEKEQSLGGRLLNMLRR